ncbi:MAG: 4Fe-4S dicluster domain-containing protein [Candidatus Bilamarchaeaceae archaeon]
MIEIKHDGCISCAGCAAVCPSGALELVGTRIMFYPEKCIQCGMCVKVCPASVIRLTKEGKAPGTTGKTQK